MGNMGKASGDKIELLPEFQKFLLARKLVPEKNIRFFAYWVSRFLEFSQKHDYPATEYQESAVMEFLDILRADKRVLDWQHRQADDAIKLYYFHYLGKSGGQLAVSTSAADTPGILKETRRLIRLKHYSYSTERTYLQWIERFLIYALQTEGRKKYLILQQRISGTFSAILQ
jgi:hypothetical protein